MIRPGIVALGVAALALTACSPIRTELKPDRKAELAESDKKETTVPGMNPLLPGAVVDPNAQTYNVTTSEELEKIDNGAEGEVYFTDPDNPDADIEGITAAFESQRSGNVWLNNYAQATRFAHRECRPLIIWFHDSVLAPRSSLLGAHLLNKPEFEEWCEERVVRLKLDSGAEMGGFQPGAPKYGRAAIERLARRYGLTKRPALAVISPRGKFVAGVDGYDDYARQIGILLKQAVINAEKEMADYRQQLEKKGYRTWSSVTGEESLFARLQRYNPEKQLAYLKEYGGRITRIRLSRLCKEDRDFILREQEEKEERKAEKKRKRIEA